MFQDRSGTLISAKDIYEKLKAQNVMCYYHYSQGTKDSETEMNEPYGPESMFFGQLESIEEVEAALRKVVDAGPNGFLIKHEHIVDGGRIVKVEADKHIFTQYVTLSFDEEHTEDIFDGGKIQLTLFISPRGMPWYNVGVFINRTLS
jgi:hypothetical protein